MTALVESAPGRVAAEWPEQREADHPHGRALVRGGLGVGAATTLASAANYLSNVVLGRALGPDEFADAALLVSGLLLLGAVALGLQLNAARWVASGVGAERLDGLRRRTLWLGAAVCILLVLAAPIVARGLNMRGSLPIAVLALGVPIYFVMAVDRGVAQASHRFGRLASSIAGEATVRLVVTAACVLGELGPMSASIALVASFVAALLPLRSTRAAAPSTRSATGGHHRSAIGATVLLLFGQVIISNGDLWVVAARLPDDAGVYAAVALIGRLVFIAAWSVITVVFPSLVADTAGRPVPGLLGRAVAATAGVGGLLTLAAAVFAAPLMGTMVGDGFTDGARLLWPYALATTVFVIANLIAVADLAAGRIAGPAVIAIGGVVQTVVLLLGATAGIDWVVGTQVVAMSALLASTVAVRSLRSAGERRRRARVGVVWACPVGPA